MTEDSSTVESSQLPISCAVHSLRMTGELLMEYSLHKTGTFRLVLYLQYIPHWCDSVGQYQHGLLWCLGLIA